MEVQTMYIEPEHPSHPSVPKVTERQRGHYCVCALPIREERAERRGAARAYCARCDRELPLRLGIRWALT